MRLEGKVAVVTGSTAGIGRATAELFASEGAKVVVCGRRSKAGEEVARGIKDAGGSSAFFKVDVMRASEVQDLIRFAVSTYGRLDILMNNAYSGANASVTDMRESDWDDGFAVMVKAAALASKYAIPEMIKAGGGSIIHVSSTYGLLAARSYAAYNTFKAALINLARQMATDYGKYAIRVNALCFGRIVTEAKETYLQANPEQVVLQKLVYPLGRPGSMREAASAALFLASSDSSFVTGHALVVDGGLTAQVPDALATFVEAALR